jgi:hypothetical protein
MLLGAEAFCVRVPRGISIRDLWVQEQSFLITMFLELGSVLSDHCDEQGKGFDCC